MVTRIGNGKSMGEIQLRGPWVAASYYNLPEEKNKWTGDGWFRTGDVGTIDIEGYLKIADRTKDLIKSGGEWISSVDLENSLMAHPAVQEAAVIAVPDPKWQERPLAVVVLKNPAGASPEELPALIEAIAACASLRLTGLMTMPPWSEQPEESRPYFRKLASLARAHGLPKLSMGMSHDLEVAIEEGATMVRIGTAIFGERSAG